MINYLNNKLILIEKEVVDKKQIIEKLMDLIAEKTDKVTNKELFLEKINKREEIGTTGIGREIVIPHARCESLTDIIIAIAVLDTAIEFNTPDGEKAKVIILVGAPTEKNSEYLKLLSSISRAFRNSEFRESVKLAKEKTELLEILSGLES